MKQLIAILSVGLTAVLAIAVSTGVAAQSAGPHDPPALVVAEDVESIIAATRPPPIIILDDPDIAATATPTGFGIDAPSPGVSPLLPAVQAAWVAVV